MRDHYDFSKMKGRKNPYIKYLKQPVTMRLDRDTVAYFKSMSEETGIPYQTLINLYLRDCAVTQRKLSMRWHPENAEHGASLTGRAERFLQLKPFFSSSAFQFLPYYQVSLPASELFVIPLDKLVDRNYENFESCQGAYTGDCKAI